MFIFDNTSDVIVLFCCAVIAYLVHRSWGSDIAVMQWMVKRKIDAWKKQNKRRIDLYTERPLQCTHDNDNDTECERYQFVGCETDGTILLIDYKIKNASQEAYVYLKLPDERILTLPSQAGLVRDHRNACDGLSVSNLRFEILVAHSKWRITYNGWMRVQTPNGPTNNNVNANDDEFQHVVFSFFWNAASNPILWPDNWSSAHLLQFVNSNNVTQTLDKWLKSEAGFDQCGAMYGRITIDENDSRVAASTIEVNLPGVRRVRVGDSSPERSVTVVGVGRDGCVFAISSIGADDCNEGCFGFVRWANGDIWPIDRSELHSSRLHTFKPGERVAIHFSTASRKFAPMLQIEKNSSLRICSGNGETGFEKTISALTTDVDGTGFVGLIICHKALTAVESRKLFEKSLFEPVKANYPLFDSKIGCDKSRLAVPFNSDECQNEALCGGKGSSLGFLTALTRRSDADFEVPSGFVLTTSAFLLHLKQHRQLDEAVSGLENIAYHRIDGCLAAACATVCGLFEKSVIDGRIKAVVADGFATLEEQHGSSLRVAIRSSAVGEDGAESSSAGQNATYLGVSDIEQALTAIRNCWASLFTLQSVSYRLQSVQPIRTQMAVAIQTMVPSDAAGVLFTHSPLDNNPNKLLVTANFGLGESVVSGAVDPDEFVVLQGMRNNNLTILDRKMGGKATRIEMDGGDCVTSVAVSQAARSHYCISDETVLALCQIGIYLEHYYRSARDIEWAVREDKIYLLQSRPMTSTGAFSSWELLHEYDTAIMSADDMHTYGNIGEVMPEAVTPLTYSVIAPSLNRAMLSLIAPERVTPIYNSLFALSHYRASINVFNAFFHCVEKEISLTNRVHGLAVFGHEFIDEELHRLAVHRNGITSSRTKLFLVCDLFWSMWQNKTIARKAQQFMERFRGTYDPHNLENFPSMQSLYDDLTKKILEMDYVCEVHCTTTKTMTGYEFVMFRILAEGSEELSPEFATDVGLMLSSCQNVESAEIPTSLELIAQLIQESGNQNAFVACDPEGGVTWLQENCRIAHDRLQSFLKKHGHRAFAEFEFSTITWGMRPALVIEMLQQTVLAANDGRTKRTKKTLTNDEIVAALKSPTRQMTRKAVKKILSHCQTSVQLRELSKSYLIAFIHELRKAYRFLGQRMQQNGLLSDSELIFYLTHQEIGRVLNRRCVDLLSKAQRRKRSFPEWKKFRFAEFQCGVHTPLQQSVNVVGDVQVRGTPVCVGNIAGRACVVRDFSEIKKIKAGDILITHCTDIAWSPYFPILSGVITELGGLISHGAVVAREYGLPCIVGATNATSIISDGDTINMNAVSGIITKIKA